MDARHQPVGILLDDDLAYTELPASPPATDRAFLFNLVHPLIIRPIKQLIAAFFKSDDGHDRLQQPLIDGLMWAGYPIMILHEDRFLIRPTYLRALELRSLFTDSCKQNLRGETRLRHVLAGVSAIFFTLFIGLESLSLTHDYLADELNTASMISEPEPLLSEFIALPLFMKLCELTIAYIALTMGYVLGKELILRDLPNGIDQFIAQIKTDGLYREIQHQSPAWIIIDIPSRLLEALVSVPAYIFKLAARHTKQLYGIKEWLEDNGLMNIELERIEYRAELKPRSLDRTFRSTLSQLLGFGTPIKKAPTPRMHHYMIDMNINSTPYPTLLEQKEVEYPCTTKSNLRLYRFFKCQHPERTVDYDLIDHYLKDRVKFTRNQFPTKPVLPSTAPEPLSAGWNQAAFLQPEIKEMLQTELPKTQRAVLELATTYQSALYLYYSKARPTETPSSSRHSSSILSVRDPHLESDLLTVEADTSLLEASDQKAATTIETTNKTPSPKH